MYTKNVRPAKIFRRAHISIVQTYSTIVWIVNVVLSTLGTTMIT